MNLIELFKRIKPYVHPYRWLVIVTLILTLIGSLMAQVNAIVLDRTVDVHIARIRSKLGVCKAYLTNRSGYGYTFNPVD